MPRAILADSPPACQPRTGAWGMMVRNGNVFSRFLVAGPMPTSTGIFLPPLVSPAPCRATASRWVVILVGAYFLLRELGDILKPLFVAVLLGYVILPVHLWVKR